jgi:hypothetical protein
MDTPYRFLIVAISGALTFFGLVIMVYGIAMGVDAGFKIASGSGKLKWWLEFVPCMEGVLYGSICSCAGLCGYILQEIFEQLCHIRRLCCKLTPDECPNCGADVWPRGKACPECGACEDTNWEADAGYESTPQTPSSTVEQEQDLAKEANEYIKKMNKRRLAEGNWEQKNY